MTTPSIADHYLRVAESNVKFFEEKVASELLWLEGNIRDIRREVERRNIFEQRNLISKAADVAEAAGKLRAAHESVATLKAIIEGTEAS